MHKDEVDMGLSGSIEEIQAERPSWVIHVVLDSGSCHQRGGRRTVAFFAPEAPNRLCETQSRPGSVLLLRLQVALCMDLPYCLGILSQISQYPRDSLGLRLSKSFRTRSVL